MGIINQHTLIFFWLLVEHEKSHMCTCHDVCSGVANLGSEQSSKGCQGKHIQALLPSYLHNPSTVSIHGGSLPLPYEPFIIVDISCLVLFPLLSLAPRLEAGSGVLWLSLEVTGGCVVSWCPNCWSHDDLYTGLVFSMILIPCWSQMIFLLDSSGFSQPVGHL